VVRSGDIDPLTIGAKVLRLRMTKGENMKLSELATILANMAILQDKREREPLDSSIVVSSDDGRNLYRVSLQQLQTCCGSWSDVAFRREEGT
jgi:hypothetical protein